MTQILITFCNVSSPRGLLAGVMDSDTYRFQWVKDLIQKTEWNGATGVVLGRNKYFIGIQDGFLLILDSMLRLKNTIKLNLTHEIHSIIGVNDSYLLAADSSHDRINKIILSDDSNLEEEIYWHANSEKKDSLHINSVACYYNDIYISLFGKKPEGGWKDAQQGEILNITTGEVIQTQVYHPHSLFAAENELYWLESGTASLYRYTPKKGVQHLTSLHGYLRGLCMDKDSIYIAASGARRKSKSAGTTNIITDDINWQNTWLFQIDRTDFCLKKKIPFTFFGSEIFDLRMLPDYINPKYWAAEGDAFVRRIWALEDELSVSREQIIKLQAEYTVQSKCANALNIELEETKSRYALLQQDYQKPTLQNQRLMINLQYPPQKP